VFAKQSTCLLAQNVKPMQPFSDNELTHLPVAHAFASLTQGVPDDKMRLGDVRSEVRSYQRVVVVTSVIS